MGRRKRKNYYGVLIGRDGPQVYSDWTECERAVTRFSGACYAGFATQAEAEAWINRWVSTDAPSRSSPNPSKPTCVSEHLPAHSGSSLPTPELPSHHWEQDTTDENILFECEKPAEEPQHELTLSAEQLYVLERVKQGGNVFFTGSAGTGKSALLREIIKSLHEKHGLLHGRPLPPLLVAVTASTGIAALNIGGTTLHSFAGVGLGKERVEELIEKIQRSRNTKDRWQSVETLIIDEVSMIDGRFFDTLETIARAVRKCAAPFGGIQLVVSGDFCQLPPVPDHLDGVSLPIKFCFEADSWRTCIGSLIVLQKVFRQEDKEFVRMLNKMRYGQIEKQEENYFLALSRPLVYEDGIEPTELFPLRQEVEKANAVRLKVLPEPSHTYVAHDMPGTDSRGKPLTPLLAEKLLERLVAVKKVTLKIGAQVMLVKNLTPGQLVNGLLGKVIAFKTAAQAIHDHDEFNLPDWNQMDKYDETGIDESVLPDIVKTSDPERVWPLVHFTNGSDVLCIPVIFDVVNARGRTEAKRDQVPLILAWAMSVHKSQGQTLDRVKVDLARTFEKGQAYVALSRARRMETLQVLHFNRSKVMAHPRVLKWHEQVMQDIYKKEEMAIMQEMDSEEAIKAFFDNDDMF